MRAKTVFIVATILLCGGCAYNKEMVITPSTLGPNEKVVGLVSGRSQKSYLFGAFSWGDDSLKAALLDALSHSKIPAQGLNNVFAEKSCTYYPIPGLFWTCMTELTGAAIQFADVGTVKIQKVPEAAVTIRPDPSKAPEPHTEPHPEPTFGDWWRSGTK